MSPVRSFLVVAASAVLLAGCSSSSPTVPQDQLQSEVSSQLEEQVGQTPDSVSCPGDLEGEVGTEMRCELTAGPDTYGLTVTVTSVEGDRVRFDIQVDDQAEQ